MGGKVSVCLITYNHEDFIAAALDGVLMQETDFEVEILVGEDCSPDRTRDIVISYQQRYPERIRPLLREQNMGSSRNFVDTLQACKGEYVALLDGDDYWTDPMKLQKQVAYLDAHPDFSLCGHRYRHVKKEGIQLRQQPRIQTSCSMDGFLGEDWFWLRHSTILIRQSRIPELPNWFHDVKNGDWALQMLCAQHGPMGFLNDVMADYRVHEGGVWMGAQEEDHQWGFIGTFEAFKKHLGPSHEAILNQKIAKKYYRLAAIYEGQGKRGKSRACRDKARLYSTVPPWFVRREYELVVRSIKPLFRGAKYLKRVFKGSH